MMRRREDAGQATVELALLLPLVLALLLAVVQVALVVRAQLQVAAAARAGARAAAVDPTPGAARAQALVSAGLDASRTAVTLETVEGPTPMATVRVRHRLADRVPLVGALLGDLHLEGAATMAIEPGAVQP